MSFQLITASMAGTWIKNTVTSELWTYYSPSWYLFNPLSKEKKTADKQLAEKFNLMVNEYLIDNL